MSGTRRIRRGERKHGDAFLAFILKVMFPKETNKKKRQKKNSVQVFDGADCSSQQADMAGSRLVLSGAVVSGCEELHDFLTNSLRQHRRMKCSHPTRPCGFMRGMIAPVDVDGHPSRCAQCV